MFMIICCEHPSTHKTWPYNVTAIHKSREAAIEDFLKGMTDLDCFRDYDGDEDQEIDQAVVAVHREEARKVLAEHGTYRLFLNGEEDSVFIIKEVALAE